MASMIIDQAGLPAGTPGFARTDGLATGALVTLTSVGGGATHRFELLWVPPTDVVAVPSLIQTGPTVWTFTPQALRYGTYRILLVVNEGAPTESREIHTFTIRTPSLGLIIPAANEQANPSATLLAQNATTIEASEQNEAFAPFVLGSSWGWWRALSEVIAAVEAGGGGGGSAPRPYKVIIGNALAGDTLNDCTILDPGDCSTFAAALAIVGGPGGGSVFVRDGAYTVGPAVPVPFSVGGEAVMTGAGSDCVTITGRQTDRRIFSVGGLLQGMTVRVPTATPGAASGVTAVAVVGGSLDDVAVVGNSINPADLTDTIVNLVRVTSAGPANYMRNIRLFGVSRLNVGNPLELVGLEINGGQRLKVNGLSVSDADRGAYLIGGLQHTITASDMTNITSRGLEINGGQSCVVTATTIRVDSTTWGGSGWGFLIDGNAKRNALSGCAVFQEGLGLCAELACSGLSGTGNNSMTGNTFLGSNVNPIQVQLGALEAGSTVVGNTVAADFGVPGVINDLGTLNEVGHNATYVIP